jgi:carbamoylphosphate synthase large subunit
MGVYLYRAKVSDGANAIAERMGIKKIALRNSKYVGKPEDIIINWGSSTLPETFDNVTVINTPECVAVAVDKLKCFDRLSDGGVRTPGYTTDIRRAHRWIDLDHEVVVRHKLNGAGGEGIEIVSDVDALPQAPLYTLYVKKKSEWRVHVAFDKVIHIARKVRDPEHPVDMVNWKVRNKANGFIFQIHNEDIPRDVIEQARRAVEALGLHFGAVDVVFNEQQGRAYVLEVNTAPGVEGTTLDKYVEAFNMRINQ